MNERLQIIPHHRARNLEELRSIILDDKEGPRRDEFLSKAIA